MDKPFYRIGDVLPQMGFTREEADAWRKERAEREAQYYQQAKDAGWHVGLRVRVKSGEDAGREGYIEYFRGPFAAWVRFDGVLGTTFELDELEQWPDRIT